MKVLFRKSDGRVLGAQAVGEDGVDKRISELALAIQLGATVYDLEEVRALLRAAVRQREGPDQLRRHGRRRCPARRHAAHATGTPTQDGFLLDVRENVELAVEHVPEAVNIPLGELRVTARRAAPRPRDPRHLPLRPARLLRHADPAAERVRRQGHLRRHALARDPRAASEAGDPRVRRAHDRPDHEPACEWLGHRLHRRADAARRRGPVGCPPRRAAASRHPRRTRLPRPGRRRRTVWRRVRTYTVPGTVGAIAPIDGDEGWLLAAGRGFVHLSPDGSTRTLAEVAPPDNPDERRRMRPTGPILGRHDGRRSPRRRRSALPTRSLRTDRVDARVISRSRTDSGWSPDGTTMYLVDSGPRVVYAFAFDPANGTISDQRVLVTSPRRSEHPTA